MDTDILIAGGGLAGLTSAIHLSRQGFSVVVIEKEAYPHHKVCGEYVSNEVIPYLRWLGADISVLSPAAISRLEFTLASGKSIRTSLPLGGFGLSRYAFDHFLYTIALNNGAIVVQDVVTDIAFQQDEFRVSTQTGVVHKAKVVLGAFGKRSALDLKLGREFIRRQSPWLAVKAHYDGRHPGQVVGLHHFDGGYCGVSRVEENRVNVCYLVAFESFKPYKNIDEHREKVVCRNPALKALFQQMTPLFEKPLTISQISFASKPAVEDHILMTGDTAGLIHPFCGNGMAMAIHSAQIASELAGHYLDGDITRTDMEHLYTARWNGTFRERLRTGKRIAALLHRKNLTGLMTGAISLFPGLLPVLIRKTHGKPLQTPDYAEDLEA